MTAEYIQRGDSIDYLNTGDSAINAGDIVLLGKRAGVAGCDILQGTLGSVHTVGVFSVDKANAATVFNIGDEAFYSETGATDTGEIKLGWVVEKSASGTTAVLIKI